MDLIDFKKYQTLSCALDELTMHTLMLTETNFPTGKVR